MLYFFGIRQLFKEAARKHPKKAYTAVFITQRSLLPLCKRQVPFWSSSTSQPSATQAPLSYTSGLSIFPPWQFMLQINSLLVAETRADTQRHTRHIFAPAHKES